MSAEVVRLRAGRRSDPPLSDEALARACAAGDPAAVAGLFDRFRRPVAGYIGRLIGGGPDVEDLLQSTFLEVARGTAVYDGSRGGVRTWLFAIATNIVRHHRRSKGRRLRLLAAASHVERSPDPDPATTTDARRKLARAHQALADLAEPFREAFVLCELEGVSARDAGRILGASEAAIWKRVSKARAAIRAAVLASEEER